MIINNRNTINPDMSALSTAVNSTPMQEKNTKDYSFTPASNASLQSDNLTVPSNLSDSLKNIFAQLQSLLSSNSIPNISVETSSVDEPYKIDLPASNMTARSPFDSNSSVFGSAESASNTGVHVGNDSNLTGGELSNSGNLSAVNGTRFSADASATNASRLDRSTSDPDDTVNFTRVEKFTKSDWNASAATRTFTANYNLGDISNATGIFQIKESGSAPPAVVARMREVKDENGDVTSWNLVLESPHFETNPTISIPLEDDGTPTPFKLEAKSLPAEDDGNRRFEISARGQTFTGEHPNDDNDITFRWGLYNNSRANGTATISGVEIAEES